MSLLTDLAALTAWRLRAALASLRAHPSNPPKWLVELWGGSTESAAGVKVTESAAYASAAVYAAVRVLAESVASLPLPLYGRLPDGGKRRARDHGLYPILHDRPNPLMTSFVFREALMGHLALRGNAYAEIERANSGRVKGLWPLRPDKVKVERKGVELFYTVTTKVGDVVLRQEDVFHIPGLSSDGVIGYSPLRLAREPIGLTLAADEYAARLFANNATPSGALEFPQKLGPERHKELKESWEEGHRGLSGAHRVAILEEGVKWHQVGMAAEDAQMLQSRKFQVNEIARIFRIPPHMIGDLERASFSNVEQQAIDFVVHTLRPWLVRWEQAINNTLIPRGERRTFFAEFLVDGLLRGDLKSRYDAYATGRQWGWLSPDDVRALENMNPLPDGKGKIYLQPLNMVPAGTTLPAARHLDLLLHGQRAGNGDTDDGLPLLSPPAAGAPDAGAPGDGGRQVRAEGGRETIPELRSPEGRRRIGRAFRRIFEDAASRIIRRERADVMRAVRKFAERGDVLGFVAWLEEFYLGHPEFVSRQMLPAFLAYAEALEPEVSAEVASATQEGGEGASRALGAELEEFMHGYGAAFATRHVGSSLGQLRKGMNPSEPVASLEALFDEWEEKRPGKIARRETVQAGNAVAKAVFAARGVTRLRWRTFGKDCPFCDSLDGKVVGIRGNFALKGETIASPAGGSPLVPRTDISHPPIHQGCDCAIVAELGGRDAPLTEGEFRAFLEGQLQAYGLESAVAV